MEMKLPGRRKRGKPRRRWLDRVRGDIKDDGLSVEEVYNRPCCMEAYVIVYQPYMKVGII